MNDVDEHGKFMHAQNLALRGNLTEASWKEFVVRCVVDLGMTPSGEPAIWRYPTHDGKGGSGMTLCQPLTESFMVLDTWSDHAGAYLHISSCKSFAVRQLIGAIDAFDLELLRCGSREVLAL